MYNIYIYMYVYVYIYIYAGELVLVPRFSGKFSLSRISFSTTSRVRNSTKIGIFDDFVTHFGANSCFCVCWFWSEFVTCFFLFITFPKTFCLLAKKPFFEKI